MGSVNCCQGEVYKHEEFRQNLQNLASPDYLSYLASAQKEELKQSSELKRQSKQQMAGSWGKGETKTGKGVIYAASNYYYEGEIEQGVAKGEGKIMWPNKSIYKGAIEGNKAEGYGELFLGQKSVSLKGNWVNGLPKLNHKMQLNRQGRHGTITFVDEAALSSELDFFKATLTVKVELGNGVIYEGQAKQSGNVYKIQGKGKMSFPDHSYYEGDFVQGKMHGFGRYHWPTGNWFEGQYKSNFREGTGTYYFSAQDYETGEWKGGVLIKPATSLQSNNSKIQNWGVGLP